MYSTLIEKNIYRCSDRANLKYRSWRRRLFKRFLAEHCLSWQYNGRLREASMTRVKRNPVNVSYNKNVNDYSLQISRWCLKPIGAWPLTDNTLERTIAFIHIAACSITIAIVTVPCILYILLEDDSLKKKLGSFAPLTHRIMGSISYWILLTHSEDIRDCIRHMEMDWKLVRRAEDHEVMLQYAKFGRFIAAISAIVMHGGQFLFSVARAIRTVEIIVDNQTFTTYPMTCPAYGRIIDTRFSPTKEIMLVTQFISAFIVGSAIVSVCSLAAVFAMHACGQLNVMYAWLNDFVEKYEKDDHLIDKKLTVIVEHHLRVLRYVIFFLLSFDCTSCN